MSCSGHGRTWVRSVARSPEDGGRSNQSASRALSAFAESRRKTRRFYGSNVIWKNHLSAPACFSSRRSWCACSLVHRGHSRPSSVSGPLYLGRPSLHPTCAVTPPSTFAFMGHAAAQSTPSPAPPQAFPGFPGRGALWIAPSTCQPTQAQHILKFLICGDYLTLTSESKI